MAETATQDKPATGETQPNPSGSSDEPLGETGLAALQREREARREAEKRAKANAEAAKRLEEIEAANASDLEKATRKAETSEARAAKLEAENLRLRVALRHGLDDDAARRLIGETEEELDEDAAKLAKLIRRDGDDEPNSQPPRKSPSTNLKSGTAGATDPAPTDPILEAIQSKMGLSS